MKLIILAAYPVQYHAPVFREISRQLAQNHHECLVIYLSKFSIQGYLDQEFGTHITWDEPLLAGYRSLTLNSSRISQPLQNHPQSQALHLQGQTQKNQQENERPDGRP
jgi:DNA polymerase III psi subunit